MNILLPVEIHEPSVSEKDIRTSTEESRTFISLVVAGIHMFWESMHVVMFDNGLVG